MDFFVKKQTTNIIKKVKNSKDKKPLSIAKRELL